MNRRVLLIAFFLVMLLAPIARADKDSMVEEGWYAFRGDPTRVYILDPPKGVEEARKYPLILLLHDFSGNAKKIAGQWHWTPGKENAYVLAPKAPVTRKIGGITTHAWNRSRDYGYLHELVEHVIREYPIDPSRVFAVGYGSGAEQAMDLINKHPRRFSRLCLIGGGRVKKSGALPGFSGLKVLILGAEGDRLFTAERIMPMAETMKRAGADVRWEILPKESLGVLYKKVELPADWLLN